MDSIVLIFIILITHGVIAENSTMKISIYAHEEDEVLLPLPEHLLNQTEYVWKKGKEHIATCFRNGSLNIPDLKYRESLNSSHDGSLIIKPQEWKNRDEYSVDVIMNNDSHSTIHYRVRVQNHKFTPHVKGPINVSATVGGNCTLPLEEGIIEWSKIVDIHWLTKGWAYFAATKQDGDIFIREKTYEGSLSSSSNGSLIFNNVRKRNQGMYRACIFLNNGKIFEQMFQVHISEPHLETSIERRTSTEPASGSENNTIVIVVASIGIVAAVIIFTKLFISRCKSNKGRVETKLDPKEYNTTRTNHVISDLECQLSISRLLTD